MTYRDFISALEDLEWTYDGDPNAIEFWARAGHGAFFAVTAKGLIVRSCTVDPYFIHAMRHWAYDKYHRLLLEKDVDIFATNEESSIGARCIAAILKDIGMYHG